MILLTRQKEYLNCTPGEFSFEGVSICKSLELPWNDNIHDVSCIPVGTYKILRTFSPHLRKHTFQLVGVPGRLGIRIHSANLTSEIKGCIAPCIRYRIVGEDLFGEKSAVATATLEDVIDTNKITEITLLAPLSQNSQ